MKKIFIYTLLFVGFFSCESQVITPKKITYDFFIGESIADQYTNEQGQQAVLLVGDSEIAYSTDNTYGPTPTANTVFEYDQSTNTIIQVTNTDLINTGFAGTGHGSMWPRFGIDYNAGTNRKPVFVDCHSFDSNLLWTTDATNKWLYDPSNFFKGDLYDAMAIKAAAALTKINVQKYKYIFIILTVNDLGDALFSSTQLNNAYNKLIEYLRTDFPSEKIYIIAPTAFDASTTTQTALTSDVRWHIIKTVPDSYANVECIYYAQYAVSCGQQTGAHWTSTMNNYMGASFASYALDTETDKYVKRVTNHFSTPLSTTHKLAWKTALTDLQTEGFLQVCNYLKMDIATTAFNERFNITGTTQPTFVEGNTYDFLVNDCIRTGNGGAASFESTMFVPSLHTKFGDANNQWIANYIQQNFTASNIGASMFGSGVNGWMIRGITVADNYYWQASDATNTQNGLVNRFAGGFWYGVGRPNSTTKNYLKDATILHTAAVGGATLNTGRMTRGGGLGGGLLNAKHEAFFVAADNGYNKSNVLTILNTLRTALKN